MSDVADCGDVEHFVPSQLTDTLSEPTQRITGRGAWSDGLVHERVAETAVELKHLFLAHTQPVFFTRCVILLVIFISDSYLVLELLDMFILS